MPFPVLAEVRNTCIPGQTACMLQIGRVPFEFNRRRQVHFRHYGDVRAVENGRILERSVLPGLIEQRLGCFS